VTRGEKRKKEKELGRIIPEGKMGGREEPFCLWRRSQIETRGKLNVPWGTEEGRRRRRGKVYENSKTRKGLKKGG